MDTTALQALNNNWPNDIYRVPDAEHGTEYTDFSSAVATGTNKFSDIVTIDQTAVMAISQFAQSNGLTYTTLLPVAAEMRISPSWISDNGDASSRAWLHAVSGTLFSYDCTMFIDERMSSESGASIGLQRTGVIHVLLHKRFPQIYLDSLKNDHNSVSGNWMGFDLSQRMQLEGDFSSYFDLYSPQGLQVDTLTILAPNFMQILKDSSHTFDVEIYGENLYLLASEPLYTPEVMDTAMKALEAQLSYLQNLERTWQYTPLSLPVDTIKKSAVSSSVVKIGPLRIKLLTLVLTVFCLLAAAPLIIGIITVAIKVLQLRK